MFSLLSPELKKLKLKLEGDSKITINKNDLLDELKKLDKLDILTESLSLSSLVCQTCGRAL